MSLFVRSEGSKPGEDNGTAAGTPARAAFEAMTLGFGLAGLLFMLERHLYLPLFDEGFVWYGVWRLGLGEWPFLDFHSYDAGRYLWIVAWQWVLGSDVPAMRAANAMFAAVGIAAAVLLLRRQLTRGWQLVTASAVVAVWVFPEFKPYEPSFALIAAWLGARMLERPSLRRHAALGVGTGVAAVFGRNFGLYIAAGGLLVMGFAAAASVETRFPREHMKKVGAWSLGVVGGYLPMLVLFVAVPGFMAAFVEANREFFRTGTTNLPATVPWPWTLDLSGLTWIGAARPIVVASLFVIVPLFCLLSLCVALARRGRVSPVWLASVSMTTPYLHHAFARADVSHLAALMPVFLVGVIAVATSWPPEPRIAVRPSCSAVLLVGLAGLSAVSILQHRSLWVRLDPDSAAVVPFDLDGTRYYASQADVEFVRTLQAIDADIPRKGPLLLIEPYAPGAYPLLGRPSPVWSLILARQASPARDRRAVVQFEASEVGWVLRSNQPFNGDRDPRYRLERTYPRLHEHISAHFTHSDAGLIPAALPLRLLVRRQ